MTGMEHITGKGAKYYNLTECIPSYALDNHRPRIKSSLSYSVIVHMWSCQGYKLKFEQSATPLFSNRLGKDISYFTGKLEIFSKYIPSYGTVLFL